MKRTLLAATAALAMALPAHAQWVVHDPGSLVQNLAQWGQQLAAMRSQYEQLSQTYRALAHTTDVSGLASQLGGVTRSYGPSATTVPGLFSSHGGFYGQAPGFMAADRAYGGQTQDSWQAEMDRRERVTANAKAMALEGYQEMQERISTLSAAEASLGASPDVAQTVAINGLIATSQANIAIQQAKIASIRMMMDAETRVDQQRAEQRQRQDADAWGARNPASTGSFQ